MNSAHTGYYNGYWYGGGTVTSSEMFNRQKKAAKLAAVLFKARATREDVINATPEAWALAAQAANCHPPNGQQTIDQVLINLDLLYADEAAEADDNAEAKWEQQQLNESGADRCPPRE